MHYLICAIEKHFEVGGVSIIRMAEIMEEKGCITAYNLDGSSSVSLIINGQRANTPTTRGARPISDMIFFATALPSDPNAN